MELVKSTSRLLPPQRIAQAIKKKRSLSTQIEGLHGVLSRTAKLVFWKMCFPGRISLFPAGVRIVSGPFQGLRYSVQSQGSYHSCKILGTYEKELHSIINSIQAAEYDTLIDIGAAEGYYAIGLACTSSIKNVIAFEAEQKGQALMTEIAKKNKLKTPIDVRGRCEMADLQLLLETSGLTIIICDVEGYEAGLLDPSLVAGLRRVSMLVEIHDSMRPGTGDLLKRRFQSTHSVASVCTAPRTWEDFPEKTVLSRSLPRALTVRAMNEGRASQMSWFWMVPANNGAVPKALTRAVDGPNHKTKPETIR
jgi:hypothetical protein